MVEDGPDERVQAYSKYAQEVRPKALEHIWKVKAVGLAEIAFVCVQSFLMLFCGAAAFTLKLVQTSAVLIDPDVNLALTLFAILAFLNQALGIVYVRGLLRWRMFRFIFGGADAETSDEDIFMQQLYESRLVHTIMCTKVLSPWKRFVTLINLNEDDIQRLVLEETREKDNVVAPLWEAIGHDERKALQGSFKANAVRWAKGGARTIAL